MKETRIVETAALATIVLAFIVAAIGRSAGLETTGGVLFIFALALFSWEIWGLHARG